MWRKWQYKKSNNNAKEVKKNCEEVVGIKELKDIGEVMDKMVNMVTLEQRTIEELSNIDESMFEDEESEVV